MGCETNCVTLKHVYGPWLYAYIMLSLPLPLQKKLDNGSTCVSNTSGTLYLKYVEHKLSGLINLFWTPNYIHWPWPLGRISRGSPSFGLYRSPTSRQRGGGEMIGDNMWHVGSTATEFCLCFGVTHCVMYLPYQIWLAWTEEQLVKGYTYRSSFLYSGWVTPCSCFAHLPLPPVTCSLYMCKLQALLMQTCCELKPARTCCGCDHT